MRKLDVRDAGMKTNILAVVALFILVFSLAACAAPPAPMAGAPASSEAEVTKAPARTRLVVAGAFLTEILDAQQSYDGGPMTSEQIGQSLIRIDQATGELVSDLAESWSFSEDGKTMIFTLPAGALYSNGDPLDAQAVADAWLRNKEVSPYASDFEALIDVKVVDAITLEAIFSDPPAAFLTVLNTSFGGPWDVAHAQAIGNEAFAIAPVASGPLTVQEFTPGSEVLLTRNENYQTGLPLVENKGPLHLTEVLVRLILEDMTLAGELETGTVDMLVNAPASAIERLRQNPEVNIFESRTPGAVNLVMNLTRPQFSDLLVRQAIATAVDREALVKALVGTTPVHAFITSGMVAYSPDVEEFGRTLYANDIPAAQALMTAAGWSDSDADGIVEKDGEAFTVELLVPTDAADQQLAAQVLQNQLKAIGIDLQISQQEGAAVWDAKIAGEYDMGFEVYAWPDPDILSLVLGAPWWNFPKYDNPELIDRLVAARYILNPSERTAAYADIQRDLLEDVVEIPLWQNTKYVAVRTYVKGLVFNGNQIFLNDVTIGE